MFMHVIAPPSELDSDPVGSPVLGSTIVVSLGPSEVVVAPPVLPSSSVVSAGSLSEADWLSVIWIIGGGASPPPCPPAHAVADNTASAAHDDPCTWDRA
jgi:hypothetical protein